MVDGVSATDLLSVILSDEREPEPTDAENWQAEAEPSSGALIAHSLALRAASPYEALRTVLAAARGPRRVAKKAVDTTRGVVNLRSLLNPNPAISLNGPIGPHRRWNWARGRLSDIKQIREAHGCTINDVVLAAITSGFRELLLSRGEHVDGQVIRSLVPVSVRTEDEHGTYDNKVSAMFAELPIELEDPVERLRSLREQMHELKRSGQAVAAERLTALSGFAPAMLLALAGRVGTRLPQSSVNTVTTNVPGPQKPLYLSGRRMLEAFPFVPLGGHVRVGVAIFSYDGGINFGVTGDFDTAPDIGVLCAGIERGVAELLSTLPPKPSSARDGARRQRPNRRTRRTRRTVKLLAIKRRSGRRDSPGAADPTPAAAVSVCSGYFRLSDPVTVLPALSTTLSRNSYCVWTRCCAISRAESVISLLLDGSSPCGGSVRSTVSTNLRTASIALRAPSSSDLSTSSDSSVLRSTARVASDGLRAAGRLPSSCWFLCRWAGFGLRLRH